MHFFFFLNLFSGVFAAERGVDSPASWRHCIYSLHFVLFICSLFLSLVTGRQQTRLEREINGVRCPHLLASACVCVWRVNNCKVVSIIPRLINITTHSFLSRFHCRQRQRSYRLPYRLSYTDPGFCR